MVRALPKMVASNIERSLCERLAAGEWSATGRLPSDRHLAAEYGVARNTIRRAVKAIAQNGFLERHVGRGTFLANSAVAELSAIMKCVMGASPTDLITVRLVIEPQAAALAAKNADPSDFEAIAYAHYRASEASHTDEYEHWDSQFHRRILAAARNGLLLNIHDILQSVRSRRSSTAPSCDKFSSDIRRQNYCGQHANIVATLKRRDADAAAQAMFRHIKAIEVAASAWGQQLFNGTSDETGMESLVRGKVQNSLEARSSRS
jgi:DNA-binding FadR family transcriptional regulator